MNHLYDTLIDEVKRKLIPVYKPVTIYIFGSYAWGSPEKCSDLDVLVIVKDSLDKIYIRPRIGLKALAGMSVPVDLIVYTEGEYHERVKHISTLCYKINREGMKVYDAA